MVVSLPGQEIGVSYAAKVFWELTCAQLLLEATPGKHDDFPVRSVSSTTRPSRISANGSEHAHATVYDML